MKITISYDSNGLIHKTYQESFLEKEIEFENTDNFEVFIQNINCYKIINDSLVRFDQNEDIIEKENYIKKIRKQRAKALQYYDIYSTMIFRGKIQESQEVEDWYQWMLDFPENYNNNMPYKKQIIDTPDIIKKIANSK
jgi:hypothetical protein